jgi:hypothetical protein
LEFAMSQTRRRGIALSLGMAAAAVLAAGLIPIAGAGKAWADDGDGSVGTSAGGSGGVSSPVGSGGAATGGSGSFSDDGGSLSTGTSGGFGGPLGSVNESGGLNAGVNIPGF